MILSNTHPVFGRTESVDGSYFKNVDDTRVKQLESTEFLVFVFSLIYLLILYSLLLLNGNA